MVVRQPFVLGAVLAEPASCHENPVIVRQRPQAVVEKPVRILAQGQPIAGIIVARVGKLVDVGGIDDTAGGDGDKPVAGQAQV